MYIMYTQVNTQIHPALVSALHTLRHPCPRPLLLTAAVLTLLLCSLLPLAKPSEQTRYLGQDRCVAWSHPDMPPLPRPLCTLSIKVGLFLGCVLDHLMLLCFQEEVCLFPNQSWPFPAHTVSSWYPGPAGQQSVFEVK